MAMGLDKHKLSWWTRIKLCWAVLTKGKYDHTQYRTRHMQKQWDTCRQRDIEMAATCRPRTHTSNWEDADRQNRKHYTDFDERNEFRKPGAKSGLYVI